jgi:4'-phosphopantetheinyl transferase EntD
MDLLPEGVTFAEAAIGEEVPPLFPGEEVFVQDAVLKRRREFASGRACARRALEQLGIAPCAIPVGSAREPQWPHGVVGSISHCDTHSVAAVGPSSRYAGIGIDVERHRPLPPGVLRLIAGPAETAWLAAAGSEACWDTLLFGIKECVHKAWFPATRQWLAFHDVVVAIDTAGSTFRAELTVETPAAGSAAARTLEGRFAVREGLLFSALAIPIR